MPHTCFTRFLNFIIDGAPLTVEIVIPELLMISSKCLGSEVMDGVDLPRRLCTTR